MRLLVFNAGSGIDGSIAAPTSRVALEVIRVDEASIRSAEAAALLGCAA